VVLNGIDDEQGSKGLRSLLRRPSTLNIMDLTLQKRPSKANIIKIAKYGKIVFLSIMQVDWEGKIFRFEEMTTNFLQIC